MIHLDNMFYIILHAMLVRQILVMRLLDKSTDRLRVDERLCLFLILLLLMFFLKLQQPVMSGSLAALKVRS